MARGAGRSSGPPGPAPEQRIRHHLGHLVHGPRAPPASRSAGLNTLLRTPAPTRPGTESRAGRTVPLDSRDTVLETPGNKRMKATSRRPDLGGGSAYFVIPASLVTRRKAIHRMGQPCSTRHNAVLRHTSFYWAWSVSSHSPTGTHSCSC